MSSKSSRLRVITTPPGTRAQIMAMNNFIPVVDCVESETQPGLWRGFVCRDAFQAKMLGEQVYFSKTLDPNNDLDKCLCFIEITDESILGYPFLLIPKEKCLFLYAPPSGIIRLPGSPFQQNDPRARRPQ